MTGHEEMNSAEARQHPLGPVCGKEIEALSNEELAERLEHYHRFGGGMPAPMIREAAKRLREK